MDNIDKLNTLLELMKDDTITPKEVEKFLSTLITIVNKNKEDISSLSDEMLSKVQGVIDSVYRDRTGIISEVDSKTQTLVDSIDSKLKEAQDLLDQTKEIRLREISDGVDGINGKDGSPDTGVEIADKLEALTGEDKLDFSALKNVPEFKGGKSGGVVARNIYQMGDVSLTSLANNDILKWDNTNKLWVNSASGGGGGIALTDLSAGTGISYNNLTGVITNSAPDQTVVLTAGTNITSITGTYPNFTINAATQGIGDALVANPLSQFASTTSLQLKGVISDETGSGALVFGTSPSLTTSLLMDSGFVLNFNAGNVTVTHSAGTLTFNNTAIALGSGAITTTGNVSGNNWLGTTAVRAGAASFFYWTGLSRMYSPSDGVIRLSNDANADFGRLQFGGTTSLFPSIKRSTVNLQAKLADDSAYTDLEVADEAYGAGWNGSLEVPTKNALYDELVTSSPSHYERMMSAMGSSIKAICFPCNYTLPTTSAALTDGFLKFLAVWVPYDMTITGVGWFQVTQGNYTADNNNKIGLYSFSGGTLTLVASCANDGALWKATSGTYTTKAFSSTYAATKGLYFIALLYNNSAEVTAPTVAVSATLQGTTQVTLDLTNSSKLLGGITAQTDLPASQAMSGVTASQSAQMFTLY